MTLSDAIIKSLDEIKKPARHIDVYNHIVALKYYDFKDAKTPLQTVSALLGDFIRNRDSRVKRIPLEGKTYAYFLTKYELEVAIDSLESLLEDLNSVPDSKTNTLHQPKGFEYGTTYKRFDERSLHKLFSSYLNSIGISSKTIFHEQSNSKDSHQKWIHPDMIGIRFLNLHTKTSQAFFKAINRLGTFELTAYELKKEIKTDYELKKCFFQAVSNSSWANYGYLVAFEISDILLGEIKRLNQSFGIGIIRLHANPFESEILFPAKYKDLDFITIDKLCNINETFDKFIEHTEKILTASERYVGALEKELVGFCDNYFTSETETEEYCKEKNIPVEKLDKGNLEG